MTLDGVIFDTTRSVTFGRILKLRLLYLPVIEGDANMAKGTIVIDLDRCKGCELCTTVCPQSVITMDAHTLNARGYHPALLQDPDSKCTGCGICAVICPDVAITVYREPALHAVRAEKD
jgi:2-oxoglutarate ferredoxin oxidoreductase subunit delta